MKDYLGVYIKFLIVLGALLIGGLLLQSLTSGQGRNRHFDPLIHELQRRDTRDAWMERQRSVAAAQRIADKRGAAERKAELARQQGLQWETVTIRMRRFGYDRELVEMEMADLEKTFGGKLAPKSLERDPDGVWRATFQWVSP